MSDDDGTEYMGSRPHSPYSQHSPIPLNTKGMWIDPLEPETVESLQC